MATTYKQVEGTAERLNGMLAARGSTYFVGVEQRNGHTALDLCYKDASRNAGYGVSRGLTVGTRGECWQFLYAMIEGLTVADERRPS